MGSLEERQPELPLSFFGSRPGTSVTRSGRKKGSPGAGEVAEKGYGAEAGAVDGGEAVEALDDIDDAEGVGVPEEAAAEGGEAGPEDHGEVDVGGGPGDPLDETERGFVDHREDHPVHGLAFGGDAAAAVVDEGVHGGVGTSATAGFPTIETARVLPSEAVGAGGQLENPRGADPVGDGFAENDRNLEGNAEADVVQKLQ